MTTRVPYEHIDWNARTLLKIARGTRPQILPIDVQNSPQGFVELVSRCWDGEGTSRPTIDEILSKLVDIQPVKEDEEDTLRKPLLIKNNGLH